MVAIGMGVAWFGYAVGLYGYCLAKQYQVGFLDLVSPTGQISWPPPLQPDTVNSQTPQPTVAEQYLAPLTYIASALASLVGGLGGAVGELTTGASGAVDGAFGSVLSSLGTSTTAQGGLGGAIGAAGSAGSSPISGGITGAVGGAGGG